MKNSNNKVLIIIGIVLMNILVVFMVAQSFMGKTSEYDEALIAARAYVEKDLCSKAMEKYEDAVEIEDNIDLRLEMISVFEKGLDSGEFTQAYKIFNEIEDAVNVFRTEPSVYEAACELLMKYEKYEDCAALLMQARDLYVTSEKIEELREQIRYTYKKHYSVYDDVQPTFDGMITAFKDEKYVYLTDEVASSLDSGYIYGTSFSEGYAFVKTLNADGTERGFVIDKSGQRQFYVEGAESASGFGRAVNSEGEQYILLTCKVGEAYKFFNLNGEQVFEDFAYAGRFRNNAAAVKTSDGKWSVIDGTGAVIGGKTFEDIVLNEFEECAAKGIIIAKENGKYHLYDNKLNQIGDFSCDGAKAFVDEYAAFMDGDKWGFVGADGTVLIEAQYEDAKSFSNSMGAIKTADGWSFINASNEIVIDEIFEDAGYLNDKGICFIKNNGSWSYIIMYYTGK